MGALLFVIVINDLSAITEEVSDFVITSFADDTNMLAAGNDTISLKENCNKLFTSVEKWFSQNNFIINKSKTNAIIFRASTTKEKPSIIDISNQEIDTVESTKFLGIIIDELLKWTSHVEYLLVKLNRVCYAFRVMREYLNENVRKIIYYANYESLIRYGIIFWGISSSVQSIFVNQKRILRILLNMGYRQSCRGKFKELGVLTVYALYLHECLLYLHRNKKEFLKNNTTSGYNTRTMNITFPLHKLSLTERSPSYMCIRIFNKLPNELKSLENYRLFKAKTKKLLIELEPYCLGDYFNLNL